MSDRDDTSGPTGSPTPAAKWMREWRRRQREKKRTLRVVFTQRYLDELVSDGDGRIKAEDLDNPAILGAEIEEDYYCQKHGAFRPGPLVVTGTRT